MSNETAIITGSTSGIGKKIAELFLSEGCKVAICSRNEDNVKKTLLEFKERFGDSVIGEVCDVTNPSALTELIEKTINAFGSIRILVANAGLNLSYGPFHFLSLEKVASDAEIVIGTNLIGAINSIAAVIPQMKKQVYGRIVTLSGGGADRPIEHMTIYSASKGGVTAFSRCLAQEFKKEEEDIKINIFQPGMIKTNLSKVTNVIKEWKDEEQYKKEFDLIIKYVASDIGESCSKVIPFALPTCKANGKSFRGFSIKKLISGFRKIKKM
ncbi:MAG: SDR family oxidoreductase, partial [Candidatus Lokiarchaeota archaeon]|nr:SDR family oxidoreductase [Candidatus Lokiarchaeota archaeon]